ncbi:MAG: hypothetical protein LQ340_003470, partial [Diploschistes diacapsis]
MASTSEPPVAIVTGAASGIGLALSSHLYSLGWKVFMADISPQGPDAAASIPTTTTGSTADAPTFVHTDVSSWPSQASLFKTAYAHGGHIDFVAANAGIVDSEALHAVSPTSAEPTAPNLHTIDVNLGAVVHGLKLMVHYARKERAERRPAAQAQRAWRQKKFVATSSITGIYPFPFQPLYCATKHGVVGLVRGAGPRFLLEDDVAVNAILPAFVSTGLPPGSTRDAVAAAGHLTPMRSVLRAYDELLAREDAAGETVEASGEELYWRKPVEFANSGSRWLVDDPEG